MRIKRYGSTNGSLTLKNGTGELLNTIEATDGNRNDRIKVGCLVGYVCHDLICPNECFAAEISPDSHYFDITLESGDAIAPSGVLAADLATGDTIEDPETGVLYIIVGYLKNSLREVGILGGIGAPAGSKCLIGIDACCCTGDAGQSGSGTVGENANSCRYQFQAVCTDGDCVKAIHIEGLPELTSQGWDATNWNDATSGVQAVARATAGQTPGFPADTEVSWNFSTGLIVFTSPSGQKFSDSSNVTIGCGECEQVVGTQEFCVQADLSNGCTGSGDFTVANINEIQLPGYPLVTAPTGGWADVAALQASLEAANYPLAATTPVVLTAPGELKLTLTENIATVNVDRTCPA